MIKATDLASGNIHNLKIPMTNGGALSPNDLAKALELFADWLQEHNAIFECDCEDYEEPRGYMEQDTGAYIHGDTCPTWQEDHSNIILRSAAQFFRALESPK